MTEPHRPPHKPRAAAERADVFRFGLGVSYASGASVCLGGNVAQATRLQNLFEALHSPVPRSPSGAGCAPRTASSVCCSPPPRGTPPQSTPAGIALPPPPVAP